MKIALAAAGTRGDVQPLIALGQTLLARGHEVQLAASPSFAVQVRAAGLIFHPMGRDVEAWLRDEGERLPATALSLFRLLNRALKSELEAQFEVLPSLTREVDVLIGAGALVAGGSVAEANRIAYRYAALTSQSIPACREMPTVLPFQGTPRWLNALAWRACNWMYDGLLLKQFNAYRARLGVIAARSIVDHFVPPGQVVLAADYELSSVPAEVSLVCTGAWQISDSRAALPHEVEAFLKRGDRPIYASFGSMPDPTPEATVAIIAEAARRAGRRVIINSSTEHTAPGVDVLVVRKPMSHARLFEAVDAVIHHGGAGTTATAARAGVAQIIIPHGGDQFGFARRAYELGIAPKPFARKRLNAQRLAEAITAANDLGGSTKALQQRLNARKTSCDTMAEHIEALHLVRKHSAQPHESSA